jgi:hypothetical protein
MVVRPICSREPHVLESRNRNNSFKFEVSRPNNKIGPDNPSLARVLLLSKEIRYDESGDPLIGAALLG